MTNTAKKSPVDRLNEGIPTEPPRFKINQLVSCGLMRAPGRIVKSRRGTLGTSYPGSKDGFLVDVNGNQRHTPTERDVFDLIGIPFVPPEQRA